MTDDRKRAVVVLAMFAASLVVGLILLFAFEPDVQKASARELVERKDDARAFFAGDFVFVVLYGVLSPIAIWRFGWLKVGALVLAAAGLVDATENVLLVSATGSVNEGAVDAAHALEVPKIALFVVGALLALAANVRAAQTLRRAR